PIIAVKDSVSLSATHHSADRASPLPPYTSLFRSHRVWHRRGTGADREADAEPAAPDSDTRGGEEDSGYHAQNQAAGRDAVDGAKDRKSTRLNSSHQIISYAVFCLKKKRERHRRNQ